MPRSTVRRLEPRLNRRFLRPEELEAAPQGHLPVEVFPVAYVPVNFGVELVFDVLDQPVLGAYEVRLDVVVVPDSALRARRPVGAAADNDALRLGDSHHVHGQFAGRIADFQCAVYVETYQYHGIGSPFLMWSGLCTP